MGNIENQTIEPGYISGVDGRYAYALFQLALEKNKIAEVLNHLLVIKKTIEKDVNLCSFIKSPLYEANVLSNVMAELLKKLKIKGIVENFVKLTIKNRRLNQLMSMIDKFALIISSHKGEMKAGIVSAHKLEKSQITKLEKELKKLAGKDIVCSFEIDPTLLGGLIVKLGSRMYDSSLKTKLNNLKIAMREVG